MRGCASIRAQCGAGAVARLVAVAACVVAAGGLVAQEPQTPPVFRTTTALTLVRFHVVSKNRYVTDVARDQVALFEDGVERPFSLFEGGGRGERTIPIEVSFLVDTSGSVVDQGLIDGLAYTSALLDALPTVSLSVYGFAKDARRYCPATRDAGQLGAAFKALRATRDDNARASSRIPTVLPKGRSASSSGASWIFESTLAAARDAAESGGPASRLLVVFSDGQPTTSTLPGDVLPELQALGVSVFPVALGHRQLAEEIRTVQEDGYDSRGQLKPGARNRLYGLEERERRLRDFAALGEPTGGRSFDPPNLSVDTVRTILAMLASRVVGEYVVGFVPDRTEGAPRARKLEVKLRSSAVGSIAGGKRTVTY